MTKTRLAVLMGLAVGLLSTPAWTQQEIPMIPPPFQPAVRMDMLLEKTIFKVNVLTLDLWLGPVTAREIAPYVGGEDGTTTPDSLARIATYSQDAWARITFLRGVGLNQFLDSIIDNLRRTWQAGILTESEYEMIATGLPDWFAPLRERDILKGDRLFYRIRGDTLRTVFQTLDGMTPVDQTDVGPERRLSVLGGFFVEGSDFRKGLLTSLKRDR
jgi:hypothetical protein